MPARFPVRVLAALTLASPFLAEAQGGKPTTGYVVLSTGFCRDSTRSKNSLVLASLFYRRPGSFIGFNLVSPKHVEDTTSVQASSQAFGAVASTRPLEYEDGLGTFAISVHELDEGEWTLHGHVIKVVPAQLAGSGKYDFRFLVVPGKVLYLGRFCAMSQDHYESGLFGRTLRPRRVYLLVSNNRDKELELLVPVELGLKGLEVIEVMPKDPSSVTPSWRATPLEPRILDSK